MRAPSCPLCAPSALQLRVLTKRLEIPKSFAINFSYMPVSAAPDKTQKLPILLFDGDCAFCRLWIQHWQQTLSGRVVCVSLQAFAHNLPDVAYKRLAASIHLILPSGEIYAGAYAVYRAFAEHPGRRVWLRLYAHLPGFAFVSEHVYRWIAAHRGFALHVTRLFLGE